MTRTWPAASTAIDAKQREIAKVGRRLPRRHAAGSRAVRAVTATIRFGVSKASRHC